MSSSELARIKKPAAQNANPVTRNAKPVTRNAKPAAETVNMAAHSTVAAVRIAVSATWRLCAAISIVVCALFILTACSLPFIGGNGGDSPTAATGRPSTTTTAAASAGPSNRLEKILADGEITVVTCPDFAPMEFIDNRKTGQSQYVGTDPWFAKYIADELGVSLVIITTDFASLQNEVIDGRADLALSGLMYTENRAEIFELSEFYNNTSQNSQGLVVLKSLSGEYLDADDFKNKKVAVQEATPQYSLLSEQLPGAIPVPITNVDDGVMMLLTEEVDALGADEASVVSICENYPILALSGFKYEYEPQGNVIGMPKGEIELCARVNGIIEKAASEGRFETWLSDAETLAEEIGWQN